MHNVELITKKIQRYADLIKYYEDLKAGKIDEKDFSHTPFRQLSDQEIDERLKHLREFKSDWENDPDSIISL
jgi:hypothetical protein